MANPSSEKPVRFQNGDVTLAGTIVKPGSRGPHPAVVFIHGSGRQTRDDYRYDIWGDAVNTASHMESHGLPGKIQVTRATYELIKEGFVCEPRGLIEVKGKGKMETWFLEDVRGPTSTAA